MAWRNATPSSSGLKWATLKMKATYSSETMVSTYKTTHCHNPEDHRYYVNINKVK
jgi:hypothetical protein